MKKESNEIQYLPKEESLQALRDAIAKHYKVSLWRSVDWGIELSQKAFYLFFAEHSKVSYDGNTVCFILLSIYDRLINLDIQMEQSEVLFYEDLITRFDKLNEREDDIDWFKELNLKVSFTD